MFSEKRLVKFQSSDGGDWDGQPEEPEDESTYYAFTVYDGLCASRHKTAKEALAEAHESMIGSQFEASENPEQELGRNIVVIQANTKKAIVQVIQGEITGPIQTFLDHQYSEFRVGDLSKKYKSEYVDPIHLNHRIALNAAMIVRMLRRMRSDPNLFLNPEFRNRDSVISFYYNNKRGGISSYFVVYDPDLNFSYILLDAKMNLITAFGTVDELNEILQARN
jgi:hypothetical protein